MLRKQHKVDDSHYDMPLIYYTEGHSLHFGSPKFALITGLPFGTVLQFNEEFSSLGRDFMDSLNILFQDLIQPHYSDEDISNDFVVEDELRLCLEDEERMRLDEEKNILEEQRFRVEEARR
ncbi:hypothetical protein Tco_0707641 [Tanacetum coccineum]|uniref:Uncharacterized protein n=1 Tax=Tanacetum coccineum TaxID=301880 RepID=A0ABQ4YCY0_9ASTR